MTAHLKLGNLTTTLVSVLATQTGLAVGDGVSPVSGVPTTSDYPYLTVYEVAGIEAFETVGAPSTGTQEWQVTATGLTRLQAARARDFATTILDPSIAIANADALVSGDRRTVLATIDVGDDGKIWSAVWRFAATVTAA